MIYNGKDLLNAAPIIDMVTSKMQQDHGVSYGLGEAGYDIRLKQTLVFNPAKNIILIDQKKSIRGRFVLGSAMEVFQMPENLVGIVHDKSTWARKGLSVFNTVIEPGFKGGLTLELVYHGDELLYLPAGTGIAQVVFTQCSRPVAYSGKYQDQSTEPVPAIFA